MLAFRKTGLVKARGRAAAFSLLEVVVAVCLLSGVLFTLGLLIPQSVAGLHNKGYEAAAYLLAEQILEEAQALDPADIPTGVFDGRPIVDASPHAATSPSRPGTLRQFPPDPYPSRTVTTRSNGVDSEVTYHLVVSVGAPVAPALCRSVSVTVHWVEPSPGRRRLVPRSWTLASHLAQ